MEKWESAFCDKWWASSNIKMQSSTSGRTLLPLMMSAKTKSWFAIMTSAYLTTNANASNTKLRRSSFFGGGGSSSSGLG